VNRRELILKRAIIAYIRNGRKKEGFLAFSDFQEKAITPKAARITTKPIRSKTSDISEYTGVLSEMLRTLFKSLESAIFHQIKLR